MAAVNIEIKTMEDMADRFEKSLEQKKAQLNDKNIQLNNTDQEKWIMEDEFCCQVWNFSHKHDFFKIWEHYPYIINPINFHSCQYVTIIGESIKDECNDRAGIQNNEHVQKLEKEIIILRKEMYAISSNNTKVEIHDFSRKLEHLKLFSEEIVELLKLVDTTENLDDDNKCNKNVVEYKNNNWLPNEDRPKMLTFTKAKILIGQYNSHFHVLSKRSNITSRMIMEDNNTIEHFIISNKKQLKSKFSVKTQSKISLKFEQKRCLKEKKREC
ncbi:hypothetical protein KPH14_011758 [Odynerus spinipes]|uniref:Uncharacterized protein n=1 Tax=Odynerus spinipes TaxID=1348599 RepID=A0AAD9RW22_9HYME|nr:hypothetical protein KPH14_011758 [Odynerus spinipes]